MRSCLLSCVSAIAMRSTHLGSPVGAGGGWDTHEQSQLPQPARVKSASPAEPPSARLPTHALYKSLLMHTAGILCWLHSSQRAVAIVS